MTKPRLMAGAASRSFAHLLGRPSAAKAKAEETDDTKKKDDADARGAKAEQESDTDDDGKAQCPVCEGSGTDDDGDTCQACEGSGEVGDGDEERREPGARGAKGDADDKDDDAAKKATHAERGRWKTAMLAAKPTDPRTIAACSMLADSDMPASAVAATLGHIPAQASGKGLYDRMGGDSKPPNPGASGGKAKPDDFAAQMAAAVGKVRPKTSK